MDDSKLLQESNLAARRPHREPHHVLQAITSEGLAQGPYVPVRGGVEPSAPKAPNTTTLPTKSLATTTTINV